VPRGSKPGERRGGRRPGSKNKRTLAIEAAVRQTVEGAKASDELPAEFLRRVAQNEDLNLAVRIDAAKACAGFFSPKLASVSATVQATGQYWISDEPMTVDEWEAEFCTAAPAGTQTALLDSVQKLEIEARDKKIAALEEEVRKLREAALPTDGETARRKIPLLS
jgi:hypothetical protein